MSARYALYYSPPTASPLGAFGAAWLGRTIEGQDLAPPEAENIAPGDWRAATAAPRKYGFHATLKAPFRLANGATENDLISAVETFCADRPAIGLGRLRLAKISGFLALRPEREEAAARLAADIVQAFDGYRAALTPQEIVRRRPDALTAAQRDLLDRWGYPYVMGEFRFHMTLTGRLEETESERFRAALEHRLARDADRDAAIDDICIFRQDRTDGDLSLLRRIPLGAA